MKSCRDKSRKIADNPASERGYYVGTRKIVLGEKRQNISVNYKILTFLSRFNRIANNLISTFFERTFNRVEI